MKVLITGGAGFIGSQASRAFLSSGENVGILEDFSRPGSRENLGWILESGTPEIFEGSVTDYSFTYETVQAFRPNAIIHLAAQVAVTLSVDNPRQDFMINNLGTFNLLEAVRNVVPSSRFIFASTNKVYGALESIPILELGTRYDFKHDQKGINENAPLDFHSPYGCSKGSADAYVLDYSRIYGLNTVVLRQSCIYGNRQFGIEDQGWIAWFIIAALTGRDLKVFGDGKQVRDALHVKDLVSLYEILLKKTKWRTGQVYNVGGGKSNSLSVLELISFISSRLESEFIFNFFETRKGDQKIFISDNSRVINETGWHPKIQIDQGLDDVFNWIYENLDVINETLKSRK